MLKFFSGMLTGILVIVITVVCCVFAVPVGAYTNMVGVQLEEGSDIKDQSIMDAVKTAVNTVQHMDTKSINDLRKTFGVDIIALVKNALQIDKDSDILDGIADAKFPEIGDKATELKLQDIITLANVDIADNIQAIINPLLRKSIKDITKTETGVQEAMDDVMSEMTLQMLEDLTPDTKVLPQGVPLFSDTSKTLKSIMDKITKNELTLGEVIEIKDGDLLVSLKDTTLFPNKENPNDEAFIGNKIVKTPINELFPDIDENISNGIGTFTIEEITKENALDSIKIGKMLGVNKEDPKTNGLLKAIADKTIKDLSSVNAFDDISIGDILTIDESSSAILKNLKDKTIGQLKTDDVFKTITIGELMGINKEDPTTNGLLKAIADKTIEDLGKADAFDTILLKDILTINESSSAILKALQNKSIGDLKNKEVIDNLTLGELLGVTDESSAFLKAIKDKKVKDLSNENAFDTISLKTILSIDESSSSILKALQDKTIGDLKSKDSIDKLTLGSLLGVTTSSPKILQAIKDKTVGQLSDPTIFDNLKISDVMSVEPDSFLMKLKDADGLTFDQWTLSTISSKMDSAIKSLKMSDILTKVEGNTLPWNLFYMDGPTKVMFEDWKVSEMSGKLNEAVNSIDVFSIIEVPEKSLLGALKKQSTPDNPITLQNIGDKTTEMVGTATLQTLKNWGVFGEDIKQETLNTDISVITHVPNQKLGSCTIADMIKIIPGVVEIIEKLPPTIPGGGSKVA